MELHFQEILVYLAVLGAAVYAGYKTFRQFSAKNEQAKCTKCGCGGKTHDEMMNKKKQKIPAHFLKSRK